MRKYFAVVAMALLFLLSVSGVEAQKTDRLELSGSQIRINFDGSISVTLASGRSVNLVPQASAPSVCKDGDLFYKTSVGLHQCVAGSWQQVGAANADLSTIAALTPSNDDILQRKAGAWTNRTLAQLKTDLALNNVTNTSDADKLVSTAQQAALDLKAPITSVQASSYNTCSDAGSTDSYACSLSPAIASYTTGQVVWFKANTVNTGAATLALNGLPAKTIKKLKDVDLADNDIKAGQWVAAQYDGTNFQMLSPVSNVPSSVTNSAGANVIPKSNGTNLVASRISDDGSTIEVGLTDDAEIYLTSVGKYINLTTVNGYVTIGDTGNLDTAILISDAAHTTDIYNTNAVGVVTVGQGANYRLVLDNGGGLAQLIGSGGSVNIGNNGVYMSGDNYASLITVGTATVGDADGEGNGTRIIVDDLTSSINITADLGIKIITSGTKPACVSGLRGTWFTTQGGTGVADKTEQCMKRANDAYAWVTVVTAP